MIGFGGGAANRLTGFKIPPIEATGGTTNTDGGFKYHIYTVDTPSPTLNLAVTFAPDDATIELLVIGGGGGIYGIMVVAVVQVVLHMLLHYQSQQQHIL